MIMIVRKKIELIVDVEASSVDYIYQSIIEGMEFNDEEGIVEYEVKDYEEPVNMDWNERIKKIQELKIFIEGNTDKFASNKNLQFLYDTINRRLIDLDENGIDNTLKAINSELYD
ncbi:MAG TPA: hypothetical protein P5513_03410 [Candidatus Diapherotrites archaeon]|nr:hypothetical protein [Candidatus Diapherotrites archaeon]